jgi:hypothetical protein
MLSVLFRYVAILIPALVAPYSLIGLESNNVKHATAAGESWFPFAPHVDKFERSAALDLRNLNEGFAGEHGFIRVKDGQFVREKDGTPVRFWGVNGPPSDLKGAALAQCARMLAKRGVNLVRIHTGYFNEIGEVDAEKVRHALEIVETMKAEGIYSHFSIYFPLWIKPNADSPWLKGYDGKKHPFAALFFNRDFQEQYRKWWTALLTTSSPVTGKSLIEEPAVAGLEIQNEDSLFFWTFSEQNLPEPQLAILEKMFGDWASKKYGSVAGALTKWKNLGVKRDSAGEGRLGFRPLWTIFNEKTPRDQDTATFLLEVQSRFYAETYAFLRKLGFKGPITASNWATASPEVFGPLEKMSYTTCDFIDRHGYFSCDHKGPNAEWSIRDDHTYVDRSALRFDSDAPGKPKLFLHPAMDPHYDGKPSMISETTWNRPNRFRSEAPIFFSVFGALQHSDAIVHFALDGASWSVKPQFWMQPWTLMSPAMMGQFPAAALVYRRGLVSTGQVLARVVLNETDLQQLKGTPLPQDAALDELRLRDLPKDKGSGTGQRIDPLIHFAGRTEVSFTNGPSSVEKAELSRLIDHDKKVVTSSTDELRLDYGRGLLSINAPKAQGISGALAGQPVHETRACKFTSSMELGHILVVSLDDQPIETSRKMLLQVMSEERNSGFVTEPTPEGPRRIVRIGTDPWLVKGFSGTVELKRPDAASLKVMALDHNGYPARELPTDKSISLAPDTLYYLISL